MTNTIINRFHFCPICGSDSFCQDSEKSLRCSDCGFELFLNPAAATVAVIIDNDGRLLVVRRRRDPARGTLDLPGGFCDVGESADDGVRREVMEETGLNVGNVEFLFSRPNSYRYSGIDIPTTDMFFLCHVTSTVEPHAMDDAEEVIWMPIDKLNPADFGLNSIREGIRRIIQENIHKI